MSRNRCTFSTVLAVRPQPFCLYDSRRNPCSFSPVLHSMRRCCRVRLLEDARPNNWGDLPRGHGVVGAAWASNHPTSLLLTPSSRFGDMTNGAWRSVSRQERMGLSWAELQRTKHD